MLLAKFENVTKLYGVQTVLDGASFQISSGRKLGLIGPNGSGKTTILRILLGQEPPTEGRAHRAGGVRVGYVPQHVTFDPEQTVMEHVLAEHGRVEAALRHEEEALATASGEEMPRALAAYQRARDAFDRIGAERFPAKAEAMLDALGLPGRGGQRIARLSGGERNILSLAEALLAEPDLLVLDEPGNHLDYMGLAWLEDFLNRFAGAVLVVSHNRYLLDGVVDGVLELSRGTVRYFEGGYSSYRAKRLGELVAQQADYVANQKRLARLEALVKKFAEIARRTADPAWGKRLRARRSQLAREKRQAVDKPDLGPAAMCLDLATDASRANVALQIRGYSRAFGEQSLFEDAELDVACGERVALVGPNGCGKTTLLRDIIAHGSWEHSTIRIGPSLTVGYCAQGQEVLDDDRTIVEEIKAVQPMGEHEALRLLGRFLFGRDDLHKRVAELSGGERNRLQLARLMVQRPDFLILDEPTNHLDIPAREAIEEALDEFEGTILAVSHDRYFLDKVVRRVVEVRGRKLVSYAGSFGDFWLARQASGAVGAVGRVSTRHKHRASGRKARADARDLERRIDDLERTKAELESRIAVALAANDRREARRATKHLHRLQTDLDGLYGKWMAMDG